MAAMAVRTASAAVEHGANGHFRHSHTRATWNMAGIPALAKANVRWWSRTYGVRTPGTSPDGDDGGDRESLHVDVLFDAIRAGRAREVEQCVTRHPHAVHAKVALAWPSQLESAALDLLISCCVSADLCTLHRIAVLRLLALTDCGYTKGRREGRLDLHCVCVV